MAPRDLVRLVDAQAAMRERVQSRLTRFVAELVAGWADFYEPDAVGELTTTLLRLVEPAQARTATLTDAYLARVISELRGRAVPPVGVRVEPDRLRGDVDRREVYDRVSAEYRYRRSQGATDEQARERAARRARVIVDADLMLAEREASRQVYTRTSGVTGYRRVIRPERSESGTCGLCVAASDRKYSKRELMPIHDRCQCLTLPIVGAQDPGRSLNRDELDELYRQAGGTDRAALKRTRYTVREHGELGPVLRDAEHEFTGPDEVAEQQAA